MSFTIPTLDEPFYSIRTRLSEADYTLEFWYSTRAERYYVNLFDENETALVCGMKLVCGVPLLKYYHHKDGVPAGELIVVCTSTDSSPPKMGELGEGLRCELSYFEPDELAALF